MVLKHHPFLLVLFLFFVPGYSIYSQHLPTSLSPDLQSAFTAICNFQHRKAENILLHAAPSPTTLYLEDLNECMELLTEGNDQQYLKSKQNAKIRIQTLESMKKLSTDAMVFQAEVYYHWAILKFFYNEEGQGIVDLKKSFDLIKAHKKKYPDDLINQKLDGIYNILLDQVPEKYSWVLELLGYKGNATKGFTILENNFSQNHILTYESNLSYYLLQEQFNQINQADILMKNGVPTEFERLVLIHLYLKQKKLDRAKELIQYSGVKDKISYYQYLQGDIALKQGKYSSSIIFFLHFLNSTKSSRNVKSANLMLFYAYYLKGNSERANHYLHQIDSVGTAHSTHDRYAQNAARTNETPYKPLLKARLLFDGGYYDQALNVLDAIPESSRSVPEVSCEMNYRKARIFHEMRKTKDAIKFYELTLNNITQHSTCNVFFAAKAALELGKIHFSLDPVKANQYLSRSIDFKNHEYEEEIENEAKQLIIMLQSRRK